MTFLEFEKDTIYLTHYESLPKKNILNRVKSRHDLSIREASLETLTTVPAPSGVRIVVRRSLEVLSGFQDKKRIKVRLMMGFDVSENLQEPREEHDDSGPAFLRKDRPRWVMIFSGRYYLWQYAQEGLEIRQSTLWKVYEYLMKRNGSSQIFDAPSKGNDEIIPVIYQPAIDSWKNFVREVHCHLIEDLGELQVTLVFNNEHLRRHKVLYSLYLVIRLLLYRRIMDVETFRIVMNNGAPSGFLFKGIYSGKHGIMDDDVHGDKPWIFQRRIPLHRIAYFFAEMMHPVIFVNTSNHAMAEHDSNHDYWKWEYVPWEDDAPVILGNLSRCQIDEFFKKNRKHIGPIRIGHVTVDEKKCKDLKRIEYFEK